MVDKKQCGDKSKLSINDNRRNFLKCGVGLTALGAIPATTSAKSTDDFESEFKRAADTDDVSATTSVLSRTDKYNLVRVAFDGKIWLGKFYTNGRREGQLELAEVGPVGDVHLVEGVRSNEAANVQYSIQEDFATTSLAVVERSTNIDRSLGEYCNEDFCDGFTYEHGQTGFSVEFSDLADELGVGTVGAAIGALVEMYMSNRWARWIGGAVGIIAAAIISVGTGRSYTISPWDRDSSGTIGGIGSGPQVRLGVGAGWNLYPDDLQRVLTNRGTHLGELDYRCG
ncbi:hypothetical protein [Natronorubrum sp. DTA28]|uniref:hypothetical protein n=1 Tax=Natronorubrum sp. DTA28 TaxID=3447019 RepID=UPI003F860349